MGKHNKHGKNRDRSTEVTVSLHDFNYQAEETARDKKLQEARVKKVTFLTQQTQKKEKEKEKEKVRALFLQWKEAAHAKKTQDMQKIAETLLEQKNDETAVLDWEEQRAIADIRRQFWREHKALEDFKPKLAPKPMAAKRPAPKPVIAKKPAPAPRAPSPTMTQGFFKVEKPEMPAPAAKPAAPADERSWWNPTRFVW